ncbi:MAG: hypothetical protein GC162_10240 [Planctomycetes bacterium]|nr:hypothetical protein [Planctomycetota bacterium]
MCQGFTRMIGFRWIVMLAAMLTSGASLRAADQWITYEAGDGTGKGKKIVFVAGDEEYRSEEGLPEMAAILAKQGFSCTVVFSQNPKTGEVDPNEHSNIPGLEALDDADLMVILTRFRDLPDDQMKHIDDFLMAGKPVIGMRTATHAFNIKGGNKTYARYDWQYKGEPKEWAQGFGRLVLGETWISHHGSHKHESTRGLIAPGAESSPLVNGIKSGDIWTPTDVYGVRLPLPGDAKPIILGQVTKTEGKFDDKDPFYGMRPTDSTPVEGGKNDPMMPVAWTKSYELPGGKSGKAFATTMGASTDLTNEALRRLIVNAVYDLLGMDVPAKANVDLVGDYKPSAFGFGGFQKGKKPADFKMQ